MIVDSKRIILPEKKTPTCLPAVEEHADDLDDSNEAEAGEEGEAEHVQLHVRPVDLHRGVLPHHLEVRVMMMTFMHSTSEATKAMVW